MLIKALSPQMVWLKRTIFAMLTTSGCHLYCFYKVCTMIKDFIRVYGFVCFILKMIKSLERSGVLYFFNILATQVKIEFIFAAFIYNVCISLF